ncbi:hypothetical protein FB45DRAFT_1059230 [Roridomyces roridus]|uniref:F-box domain-containing protein n=1 Tax=Roridomyces roridus TaxID=1738132 RepID=A0AAD7BR52_9AGAR|nr:hypothetical protein FB45DRAFT_1059230 [Roridomyces roridus]
MERATSNHTPPILRLPNELIAEIAAAGLNEAARHHQVESPIPLSHVCQHFRRAILGTSALWTKITLDVYRNGSVNISRLYLERSATRELRVSLKAVFGDAEASSLLHLIPHIKRISWLSIAYLSPEALSGMLAPFEGVALPRLQHIEFDNYGDLDDRSTNLFSLDCPGISSLILSSCLHSGLPPHWLNNLTCLELKEGSSLVDEDEWDIFLDIQTQAPCLTHLHFDFNWSYGMDNRRISSKSLTHMHLLFPDESHEGVLDGLASCDTPALIHLTLHESHGDQISLLFNAPNHPETAQLVFPALSTLVFISVERYGCNKDPTDTENFEAIAAPPLLIFPSLSSLTLIGQCFTARILSETLGPESAPWPLLRTVTVRPLEGDVDEVYAALQEVVQWKRKRQEPLPAFRLSQNLFARGYWQEAGVDVELPDDREVLDLLALPAKH